MYTINLDAPREIASLPQASVGAPLPMLVADEYSLLLAYHLEEGRLTPEWLEAAARSPLLGETGELCSIIRFSRTYAHMFGPPNDEAFAEHPLSARGLKPYAVFEIEHSSWVHSLERMNAVHPNHRPEHFNLLKHYIFAFHDTTFECIAESFQISLARGTPWSVLQSALNKHGENGKGFV